jgi:hypothetical protein
MSIQSFFSKVYMHRADKGSKHDDRFKILTLLGEIGEQRGQIKPAFHSA